MANWTDVTWAAADEITAAKMQQESQNDAYMKERLVLDPPAAGEVLSKKRLLCRKGLQGTAIFGVPGASAY